MSIVKGSLGAVTALALILAASAPAGAAQRSAAPAQPEAVKISVGGMTDVSSARRRRGGGNNGGAAAAAAFAGIIGTAIAAGVARDRYYDDGYYYGRRGYYGGGPAYYGGYGGPAYGYGGGYYGPGYGRW